MNDLTKGKPIKAILLFALPLYIGQLFSLCYSLIDTRIIGSALGESSLAAVGATTAISDVLIEFENGVICGFGIIIARFFGAQDEEKMKRAIGATVVMGCAITVIISALCLLFMPQILIFMNVSDTLLSEARSYITIIVAGMIALSLYNICAAVLRAVGDSVTPLLFLIVSNILNVGLDILFVIGFEMGVAGAAYATVLTQAFSAFICFLYMRKKYPYLRLVGKDLKPDLSFYKDMLPTGLSMAFMVSFVLLGSLALQTAINGLGDDIIVAHTAARKSTTMFLIPIFALGTALATYCGQNLGAGEYARIRQGIKSSILLSAIWCAVIIIIVFTLSPVIISLITASNKCVIIDNAVLYLKVNASLYILPSVIIILRNSMQGFGDSKTPIVSSVCELIGKILIAYLLVPKIAYLGVIISEPVVWVIMIIPLIISCMNYKILFS